MKYRTGLVVGKFAPLTRGHEALIEHALSQCEELIVLSYTSADYGKYSDPDLRERWLTQFTKTRWGAPNVKIAVLRDNQSFPPDEAPEEAHRQFCALCTLQFKRCSRARNMVWGLHSICKGTSTPNS